MYLHNHIPKTESQEPAEGNCLFLNVFFQRKEMRKGGHGKGNWGDYKDDLKDYG